MFFHTVEIPLDLHFAPYEVNYDSGIRFSQYCINYCDNVVVDIRNCRVTHECKHFNSNFVINVELFIMCIKVQSVGILILNRSYT